jgi:hypothetical protein
LIFFPRLTRGQASVLQELNELDWEAVAEGAVEAVVEDAAFDDVDLSGFTGCVRAIRAC